MFPKILDGADVLYYTPYDNFGEIYWDNGEIAHYVKYLAICVILIKIMNFTYSVVMNNMMLLEIRYGTVLKCVWL